MDCLLVTAMDGACCLGTCVYTPLNAPLNLRASLVGERVQLNWNDNSNNEDEFVIERSSDGRNWEFVGRVGTNNVSFEDDGTEGALSPGIEGSLFEKIIKVLGNLAKNITGYIVRQF